MSNDDLNNAHRRKHETRSVNPGRFVWRSGGCEALLTQEVFENLLIAERRRAERSRRLFALMLVSSSSPDGVGEASVEQAAKVIGGAIRESDLIGWYEQKSVLGVMFTELGATSTAETLRCKFLRILQDNLGSTIASKLVVSLHTFPESCSQERPGADPKLYPELSRDSAKNRLPIIVKRGIDVLGSIALLLGCAPLLAVIAVAIKLTSCGPVVFRQERLGQLGEAFECLKFRTMYLNNNENVHRDYVRGFIAGNVNRRNGTSATTVYKLVNDPRVTAVGKILRKTSLDELPQFWNVLRGEMSLVGPRPPLRYEFEAYEVWHQRRVVEVKPGITGLWQVAGRSRTSFDEMVRLDLRYCREWSLWMDLRILLATPRAVLMGDGAF
ncbi:MAG: sugar transferase [Candidatus Acidiferrales bacterium]